MKKKKTLVWWTLPGIIIYVVGCIVFFRGNYPPIPIEKMDFWGFVIAVIGVVTTFLLPNIRLIQQKK